MMPMLPQAIVAEVCRVQEWMSWPYDVPAWAELRKAGKPTVFKRWEDLNLGDCEQLAEYYRRSALKAIARYLDTGSPYSAATAGKSIVYCQLYRCKYVTLTGRDKAEPGEMPFDGLTYDLQQG